MEGDLQMRLFRDIQCKEFQCPVCTKYFSRKFTLDAHLLIHEGIKPYPCQFCGKSFRQKGTLMRHKALHSSKNLFHCSLCNRGFRQKNVFIHHLRHRHNVSTETLDRRKYRTEPKDYQSIMDTLPPFVHADSTAIASSGKHFDAVLSESIQMSTMDCLETSQSVCGTENKFHKSINTFDTESLTFDKQINIAINDPHKFSSQGTCESELGISEEYLKDIKPIFNNNTCKVDIPVSSINNSFSNMSHAGNPDMLIVDTINSNNFHSSIVTSSNDINDESLMCIPCNSGFNTETEFKCHMKTHVQSVLLGDVNSTDFILTNSNPQTLSDTCIQSDNSVMLDGSLMTHQSSISKRKKFIACDNNSSLSTVSATQFSIKTEISDSEDICLPFKKTNAEACMSSSICLKNQLLKNGKLICPICKALLQGESLKMHSKKHDSYSLLKMILKSCGNKISHANQTISTKSYSTQNQSKDSKKYSQQKAKDGGSRSVKCMIKDRSNKILPKPLQCMLCKKLFSNKFLLEYHHQLHLSTKAFSCKWCKKTFSSKNLLLSHTRLDHLKTFTCSKCSRIFNYCKLFTMHKKRCITNYDLKNVNGRHINFPVVNIESLLNSDADGIVGIIPVCDDTNIEGKNIKVGIPIMSLSQIKTLYLSTSNESKQ